MAWLIENKKGRLSSQKVYPQNKEVKYLSHVII